MVFGCEGHAHCFIKIALHASLTERVNKLLKAFPRWCKQDYVISVCKDVHKSTSHTRSRLQPIPHWTTFANNSVAYSGNWKRWPQLRKSLVPYDDDVYRECKEFTFWAIYNKKTSRDIIDSLMQCYHLKVYWITSNNLLCQRLYLGLQNK